MVMVPVCGAARTPQVTVIQPVGAWVLGATVYRLCLCLSALSTLWLNSVQVSVFCFVFPDIDSRFVRFEVVNWNALATYDTPSHVFLS